MSDRIADLLDRAADLLRQAAEAVSLPAVLIVATVAAYAALVWSMHFTREPGTQPGRHTARRLRKQPTPRPQTLPALEVPRVHAA